jgi:hypothetical protein
MSLELAEAKVGEFLGNRMHWFDALDYYSLEVCIEICDRIAIKTWT